MNPAKKTALEMESLRVEIDVLRKLLPDKLVKSGWTDTYWDGSFGPMHKYEIWEHPSSCKVQEIIEREDAKSDRIARREMKKVWGSKHECGKKKCYWHE